MRTNSVIAAAIVCLVLEIPALTQNAPPPAPSQNGSASATTTVPKKKMNAERVIQELDTNHDGCVSHEEWKAAALGEDHYQALANAKGCVTREAMEKNQPPAEMDTNGDGYLTVAKMKAFAAKQSGAGPQSAAPQGQGAPGAMPGGAMSGAPGGTPDGGAPGAMGGGPGPAPTSTTPDKAIKPAVYIDNGVYLPKKSNLKTVSGGKIGNESAADARITAKADEFNGVYVKGDKSVYTLSNATIDLYGNGSLHNDNYGLNAGALAGNGGTLILKNVKITTNGVAAPAAVSTYKGTLKVYDSTLIAKGGTLPKGWPEPGTTPESIGPPSPLKIYGTSRTTNVTHNGKSYFYNSTIIAENWGALSTDLADEAVYLEANDCDIQVLKSGYGTYADGGATVVINRSKMNTATYAGIMAGGNITLNDTTVNSGVNGLMVHDLGGGARPTGKLEIHGGKMTTGQAVILVKGAAPEIVLDKAELLSSTGVLIQTMVNDDPNAAKLTGQKLATVKATLKHMTLEGNIAHEDTGRDLSITFEDMKLKGAINGATLSFDASSKWTAAANSRVTLVGDVNVANIDAPAGVTVSAVAGNGCALKGTYNLASGGTLNISAM